MKLPDYVVRQLARPSGLLGRLILKSLNRANREMNATALETMDVSTEDRILEIGFGGGSLIREILASKPAYVAGTELSELAHGKARQDFADAIASGQLHLELTDGARLPFPADSFSKACCVNVVYFWEDLDAEVLEAKRILAPGGKFVLCYEPMGPNGREMPTERIEQALVSCEFHAVKTHREENRQNGVYFCTSGHKADSA